MAMALNTNLKNSVFISIEHRVTLELQLILRSIIRDGLISIVQR